MEEEGSPPWGRGAEGEGKKAGAGRGEKPGLVKVCSGRRATAVMCRPSGVTVTGAAPRPAWYGGPAGTAGREPHTPCLQHFEDTGLTGVVCVAAPPPYRAYTTLRVPSQLGAQLSEKRGSADSLVEAVRTRWSRRRRAATQTCR